MKVGINGAVRGISGIKVGINGAVRSATELWQGKNGAAQKVWPIILPLNDYSWDEISDISASGDASNYFEIGDCKEITLNGTVGILTLNNYTCYAYIIGFDHNASREGSNRIHFQLAKTALSGGTDICFTDGQYLRSGSSKAFRMNTHDTNIGGWGDSHMRNNICGTSKSTTSGRIMGAIPAELRAVLKSVTKYTNNAGGFLGMPDAVTATTDYFFLLSEYEVFGDNTESNGYEANYQQQYAYYSAGNSKVKRRHNSTSSAAFWWLRSPSMGGSDSFVFVVTGGTVNTSLAATSRGFTPGFCV